MLLIVSSLLRHLTLQDILTRFKVNNGFFNRISHSTRFWFFSRYWRHICHICLYLTFMRCICEVCHSYLCLKIYPVQSRLLILFTRRIVTQIWFQGVVECELSSLFQWWTSVEYRRHYSSLSAAFPRIRTGGSTFSEPSVRVSDSSCHQVRHQRVPLFRCQISGGSFAVRSSQMFVLLCCNQYMTELFHAFPCMLMNVTFERVCVCPIHVSYQLKKKKIEHAI